MGKFYAKTVDYGCSDFPANSVGKEQSQRRVAKYNTRKKDGTHKKGGGGGSGPVILSSKEKLKRNRGKRGGNTLSRELSNWGLRKGAFGKKERWLT